MIDEHQQRRWFARRLEPPATDSSGERKLSVRVPGSTANLGPGFDTLGLALNLFCQIDFVLSKEKKAGAPLFASTGALTQELPQDQDNLISQTIRRLWSDRPALLERLSVTVSSQIPLGKGSGSSAAAIVGTVWAAQALSGMVPDPQTVLNEAYLVEGHADNIAASLLGGLVVCAYSNDQRAVITEKLPWPDSWRPLLLIPNRQLSTKQSRALLPAQVAHADAVFNVQKTALLLAAVANKDEQALRLALTDRLHEPYRLAAVPELGQLRKQLKDLPILGCVLSGAGPAVLVIVEARQQQQVIQGLRDFIGQNGVDMQLLDPGVNHEGLQISYE